MTRDEAREVFRFPYKRVIDFVLDEVNLTDSERRAINLCDIKGIGEERTAEEMDISPRHVRDLKKRGYDKICAVWQNDPFVRYIISSLS